MAALTAARTTIQKGDKSVLDLIDIGMKASTVVQQGSLVVSDAGVCAPGRAALGLLALGMATAKFDNSAGAASAVIAVVRRGVFQWANSAAADAIAQANVGQLCYIVDDQTVALTDGNNTRSIAGKITAVDSNGVWVETYGLEGSTVVPKAYVTLPVDMPSIAAGVIATWVPPFAGRILAADFAVAKPVTTAAKLATLQPRIATVATTGGAIALTSANSTVGARVAGTAITAANTFAAGASIDIFASAVTTFVEGTGAVVLAIG